MIHSRCSWGSRLAISPSPAHTPGTGSYRALLLTLMLYKLTMASIEQSLLDLTDKDTWEKLSLWDRRTDAMAPLTEKQMDSVLELRAASETLCVPSEVRWEPASQLAS